MSEWNPPTDAISSEPDPIWQPPEDSKVTEISEEVTITPEGPVNLYGDQGIDFDTLNIQTEEEDVEGLEWQPDFKNIPADQKVEDYYMSMPLGSVERLNFENWISKGRRMALPSEIEAAKRGEKTTPLTVKEQVDLDFYNPNYSIEFLQQDNLTKTIHNFTRDNKEYVTAERYKEKKPELESGWWDNIVDFAGDVVDLGKEGVKYYSPGLYYGAKYSSDLIEAAILDPIRLMVGEQPTIWGEDIEVDTELDGNAGVAQQMADEVNNYLKNTVGTKVNYFYENGKIIPKYDVNETVTLENVLEAEKALRDFQREEDIKGFSPDEQKAIELNNEVNNALNNGDKDTAIELSKELNSLRDKIGGEQNKKIFAEDGSYIDKGKATEADLAADADLNALANEKYALTDQQSMLKERYNLAMKLVYLAKQINKDPRVIGRGMGFFEAIGNAYEESEGIKPNIVAALESDLKRERGFFGTTVEGDFAWEVDRKNLALMAKNSYVDNQISYLPGNSEVANTFNSLLKKYRVISRAIELNLSPTSGIENSALDNLATLGTGFRELLAPSDVSTGREEAREFLNFVQNDVGINISDKEAEILDVGSWEIASEMIPSITQVIGEFYLARKLVGSKNIKKIGDAIRILGANKSKTVRKSLNVSAAIVEEAIAIQARNTAIAPLMGEEDMSLKWAVGAGAMSSFAKYFSPEAVEGIWTTGNKTVNRIIVALGSSQTAKLLAGQTIEPAVGTGVMIAGEMTEHLLSGEGVMGTLDQTLLKKDERTGERSFNWENLVGTWMTLWALKNAKAPLNIVREPYRAVEADILALGGKTRFTQKAAKELGLESNYMEKNKDGDYKITEDQIQKKYREKLNELANNKELSPKEKSERLKKLRNAYKQMRNHRQYLDIKKAIKAGEGGKQLWADQYVAQMNLSYGRNLKAADIEALGNTPSAKLTRLLVEDPYNPLSHPSNSALSNYIYKVRQYAADLSMQANLSTPAQGGLRGKARLKFFEEKLKQDALEVDLQKLEKAFKNKEISEKIYNEQKEILETKKSNIDKNIDKIEEDYINELSKSDKFEKVSKPLVERAREAGYEIIEDRTLEGEAEIGGGKFKYNPDKAPYLFTLGVHEVGHPIINKMFEGKTQAEKDAFIKEFKNILPERTYRMIEERLLGRQNVRDYRENPNTVEWMNIFLDLTSSGALKYEGSFFDKVSDFLNKHKKGKDYSLDLNFESPKEVYENLKAFAEAAGKGKAGVGEKGDMLVEALEKSPQMQKQPKSKIPDSQIPVEKETFTIEREMEKEVGKEGEEPEIKTNTVEVITNKDGSRTFTEIQDGRPINVSRVGKENTLSNREYLGYTVWGVVKEGSTVIKGTENINPKKAGKARRKEKSQKDSKSQKSVTIDLEKKENQDKLNEQVGERNEEGYYTMPKKEWLGSRAYKIAKNLIDGGSFDKLIGSKIKSGKDIYGETRENILEDSREELKKHLERFNPQVSKDLFGYLNTYIGAKVGIVTGRAKKTVPTVSRDIQVEGRKMPEPESKELSPEELADIALEKERKAKAEKDKPKETIASKIGMPKEVKTPRGRVESNEYIEKVVNEINFKELKDITTEPGPNQTISPFLSNLKAKVATDGNVKKDISQGMGRNAKEKAAYLKTNFEKIVKSLPPSYFSGLIEREINTGKEVSLPKNMIQKDIGKGYTSNWQGKKTVGTKAAKTGITSGLKRIRLNPNFDFKNKANIEAFQKAFKSQGRYEGLAGQIGAKGVIDLVEKSLGTGNKIDTKIKDIYELQGRELPKDYAKQFREQIAKSEVERSETEEKKDREKIIENVRKNIITRSFIGEMQGMASWIKSFAKDIDIAIAKEIGADGNVRDYIGQQRLADFASKVLSKYFGESILSGQTWSNTKKGSGMWFSSEFRNKVLEDFIKEQKGKSPLTTKEFKALKIAMGSPGLDPMKTNPFGGKQSGKWKDKVNTNYEGLDLFIDKSFKMLKENPDYLGEFLAMMKGASSSSTHFWRNFAQVIGKHMDWADKVMMDPKKKGVGVGEHALVQNQAGEFMTKAILESIARDNPKAKNIAKELLKENYFQILISHGSDNKLTEIGLQSSMPKGFWESWNKALETGNIKEAWSVWSRYFNKEINKIKGPDGELGFNPNRIILFNRKTGEIESLADILGIGEKHFGKDVLNPEIIAKQQELIGEWARRNPEYNNINKLREHLAIELDMLNAKRDATLKSKTELEKIDNIFKISEKTTNTILVEKSNTFDKALKEGRKIKKEIRKARVFDFDDTIAKSKSKVLYETLNGEKGKLTPAEFAARGEELKEKGVTFDFSEFNKVVKGKKGPLFELFKKMKEAAGDRDMFVLTARAPASAIAIHEFLKEMGVDIPLKNITGLGDSSPYAKSDWIVGKAAEGYNDFYFADDHFANVKAVKDALNVLDVKSKVQQAIVQKSNTLDEGFNEIIENATGIDRYKIYSDVKAGLRGKKAKRQRFFIPSSAEDFLGLLYTTLPKGRAGEKALKFYDDNLLKPYARAIENLSTDRVNLMQDFKVLKEKLKVPKDLKKITKSGFSNEQAVRVYIWNKLGTEIPGISKADLKELTGIIEKNYRLKSFAEQILRITKGDGYSIPKKDWAVGTITTDLRDLLSTTKRNKYLTEWKDNVDIIFSEQNLNKLEAAYGSKYREALENMLTRMKSGKNRTEGGNRLSNRVLDYINNSTGTIMFFNTRSAILQTISAANFINWSFNNPYKAGLAFANQPQYWKDFAELMNSDYLVDRRNGLKLNINESEIADAAKSAQNKAKAVLNYILEKGYLPTKYADSFAIASGGATFYRNRIKDLMKNEGKTEAEAKKIAMSEFRKISEMSQQSADPGKISQQQASDLGRVILQFVNTPMQYARLQKRDIQDMVAGRRIQGKTLAESNRIRLSRISYYGFIQNLIFNALQQGLFALGFGDDEISEKEEEKIFKTANGMLDSSLRGLGMTGVTVQVIKNLGINIYEKSKKARPEYSNAWKTLLEFSPAIKSKFSKLSSAAWPFDSKKRRAEVFEKGFSLDNPAYESLAKVITATTNTPLDRLYSKVNNIRNAFDEDVEAWQSLAMILGWPEWQLTDDKKEKEKEKEKEEKKKKTITKGGYKSTSKKIINKKIIKRKIQ